MASCEMACESQVLNDCKCLYLHLLITSPLGLVTTTECQPSPCKTQRHIWSSARFVTRPIPVASVTRSDSRLRIEGLRLGSVPDDQAERDLVHEVRQVVDEVESGGSDGAAEVAEEVTQGVDGPADRDDEAHGTESGPHGLGNTSGGDLTSLADEDLAPH